MIPDICDWHCAVWITCLYSNVHLYVEFQRNPTPSPGSSKQPQKITDLAGNWALLVLNASNRVQVPKSHPCFWKPHLKEEGGCSHHLCYAQIRHLCQRTDIRIPFCLHKGQALFMAHNLMDLSKDTSQTAWLYSHTIPFPFLPSHVTKSQVGFSEVALIYWKVSEEQQMHIAAFCPFE